MTRLRLAGTVLIPVLVISLLGCMGCRGRREPASTREEAYRANNRGVALLEQFKYQEAATAFRQALGLDPSLGLAHVNLSLALMYLPDPTGAAAEATQAAQLFASLPQPAYTLGLLAVADNREADALRFFERVRQVDPRDVGTLVNLGQIHLRQRDYAGAIAVLRPAVAEEPYNVTATYNLGLALTRAGQVDEGQRMLTRSQTLRSTPYAVTFGTMYFEQGRYAQAIASTGAEPALVDATAPRAAFASTPIGPRGAGPPFGPSPFGRQFSADDLNGAGGRALAEALGGAVTLIDIDGDDDLDVFTASSHGERLLRNDGRGVWTDVTDAAGLNRIPAGAVDIGVVAGDYDNDGAADLFVLRYGGSSLYHNDGRGRFTDVTAAAGIPSLPFLPGAAAFVDVDHDGDLDLVIAGLADLAATSASARGRSVVFPRDFAPGPLRVLRNNGNGRFVDITRQAGLDTALGHAIAIVPTDFDNRRDIDLLVVYRDTPPRLFKNLRDGTFADVAVETGLAAAAIAGGDEITAVAAADVNKDDFPDFFFARAAGGGVFALSDGFGRFTTTPGPPGSDKALGTALVDFDNDGLVDLLTWSGNGPHLFRNLGQTWTDVTRSAFPSTSNTTSLLASPRALAVADLDGDGNPDFLTDTATTSLIWHNGGDARHHFERVRLKARVSNRTAAGAKVQLRAGSLSARIETSAATPAVAPADVIFGLGTRDRADVVRILWPSGILQAETIDGVESSRTVEELDRKASSCPFLFTWNGERFEFITDFMGGGEMGYWEGPGQRNRPNPVEYVRIRGDQLQAKDGRYDIRVTNELEEALFADRFELVAVAHPREIAVFPNEGMTDPPRPFLLHAVRDEHVPPRVTDDHGHDVTPLIARIDRRYPDDFALGAFRGYAAEHTLTIEMGPVSAPAVLLLTAWTDYAFSSDNLAARQAGLELASPRLDVRDTRGDWRKEIADLGIPVGRPQTMAIDLAGHLRPGEHELRIVTNMRIYWDQIHVASAVSSEQLAVTRIEPRVAALRARGFSAEVRPDGKEPAGYDFNRVTLTSPWKAMPGHYTREGDVLTLLTRSDDMFVIAKPGDEIALSFDTAGAGPLPDGWTRTFLLMADGFSKEMDINSASPDVVEPLPFHRMSRYPYAAPEHYPDTPAHRRYRDAYNTRLVIRSLPSLDGPRTKD